MIWEYSSQSVSSQATSELPKNDPAEKMLQADQAKLATQTVDNITTLGVNVNISNNNNPEKSDLVR